MSRPLAATKPGMCIVMVMGRAPCGWVGTRPARLQAQPRIEGRPGFEAVMAGRCAKAGVVAGLLSPSSSGCSGDDLGAAGYRGLGVEVDHGAVERPAAAVDRVGRAVAGVDAVVAVTTEQLLRAAAAGDLIVAVAAGQSDRARAAGEHVGKLRAHDGLHAAADAVLIARAPVAPLHVHRNVDAGGGVEVVRRVKTDAAVEVHP